MFPSQQPDHLVVEVLGHGVGVVVLHEAAEVELARDLLPAPAASQSEVSIVCCVLLSANQSSPARQPGLAVHGDHEAGPLEPLLARSVEIVTVLLGLKSHHNLQTHCRR